MNFTFLLDYGQTGIEKRLRVYTPQSDFLKLPLFYTVISLFYRFFSSSNSIILSSLSSTFFVRLLLTFELISSRLINNMKEPTEMPINMIVIIKINKEGPLAKLSRLHSSVSLDEKNVLLPYLPFLIFILLTQYFKLFSHKLLQDEELSRSFRYF